MRPLSPVLKAMMSDPKFRKSLTELMLKNKDAVTSAAGKVGNVFSAAKKRLRDEIKLETVVEPNFDQLVQAFSTSRNSFNKAEEIFWHMRIQNEEMKELIRVLQRENEVLQRRLGVVEYLKTAKELQWHLEPDELTQ